MSKPTSGHILKFLQKQQAPSHASRRLFPQQKIGHSKQSPDWFRRKFSLQSSSGYEYKHDEPQISNKFKYQSQKHHFFVSQCQITKDHQQQNENSTVNNLKKGLLSEFLDNNSWMKTVVPLTGFQRDKQSRRLSNKDRDKNIEAVQFKKSVYIASKTACNFYASKLSKPMTSANTHREIKTSHQKIHSIFFQNENPQNQITITGQSALQASHHHQSSRSRSIPSLMATKQKIRSQRLQLVNNKIQKIEKMKIHNHQFNLKKKKMNTIIDSQYVQARMALTARQWGGKKMSPFKTIERFDEVIGWNGRLKERQSYKIGGGKKVTASQIESDNLMEVFQGKQILSTQI